MTYNADIEYPELHASNSVTPTYLSLFRGNAFVAAIPLGAGVAVAGGNGFRVRSGTIRINGATS